MLIFGNRLHLQPPDGCFPGKFEWLPFMPTNRIRAVSAANVPTELHAPALLAPWGIESQEVYETSRVRVS